MKTGIVVRDPIRTFNVTWGQPKLWWFNYSNYLIDGRELLIKKFYRRRLAINNVIVWGLTVLTGVAFLSLVLFLIYISGIWIIFNSVMTFMFGIFLAELTLIIGMLIQDKLSDRFPLDETFISVENRKKKK
jgi:hypothetical protein